MPPRTAGFGNRDRFELNGKIGLHRAAGLIVLRECRQWQHNVALSGSIPLQPAVPKTRAILMLDITRHQWLFESDWKGSQWCLLKQQKRLPPSPSEEDSGVLLKGEDGMRGRYETQFRKLSNDANALAEVLRIWDCAFGRCALSGVMKRFRQFGCAEHTCDALDVVCHRREADFDPCTGQPAHQQTRMSEDTVLDRREGMLDSAST